MLLESLCYFDNYVRYLYYIDAFPCILTPGPTLLSNTTTIELETSHPSWKVINLFLSTVTHMLSYNATFILTSLVEMLFKIKSMHMYGLLHIVPVVRSGSHVYSSKCVVTHRMLLSYIGASK